MNLTEILTEQKKEGTYSGVHFDNATKKAIRLFTKENDIPNVVPRDKLHTTVLYSRKHLPDYKPLGKLDTPLIGKFKQFDLWKSQDGNQCLVMLFDCTDLVDRHKFLMKEHDATYDYDEYKPHVTLSYDVGENFNLKSLPSYEGPINITEEYMEPLVLDWAKKD